jgi:hypothetical protein
VVGVPNYLLLPSLCDLEVLPSRVALGYILIPIDFALSPVT